MDLILPGLELTPRTPRIIGRKRYLDRLQTCLHQHGARHVFYFKAGGGLGKTRILQALTETSNISAKSS